MSDDIASDLAVLRGKVDRDLEVARAYREAVKAAEQQAAATVEEYRPRIKAIKGLQKRAAAAEKQAREKKDAEGLQAVLRLKEQLATTYDQAKSVRDICPKTGSLFVRAFLGRVNVRVQQKSDREKLRDEYGKFKDRANKIFVAIPLLVLLVNAVSQTGSPYALRYTEWLTVLAHVWLVYYFVSLALRENILKVNGSAIRPWWIHHHYISALMSIVMLTWPSTDTRKQFGFHFTMYFLVQGFVQLFQARYQKSRHYTLRTLGRVSKMDVASTETITEWHSGLTLVLAFVFIAQGYQLFNGFLLLAAFWQLEKAPHWWEFKEEVQILFLGCCFVVLAVCNFWNTLATVLEKCDRLKRKPAAAAPPTGMARSASRPSFAPTPTPTKKSQ